VLFCDLHTHTTASDGTLTPLQLVDLAIQRGLAGLGVTDHDTAAGLPAVVQAAKRSGLPIAWGIELSVDYQPGTLHMLGYFFDLNDSAITDYCQEMVESRNGRNAAILDRLTELNMPIDPAELRSVAKGATVGRPHIADCLVNREYVSSREEAFAKYLSKDNIAYVDRQRIPASEAIALIRNAGGVPVLAHPLTTRLAGEELKNLILSLKSDGLIGLESHYYSHTLDEKNWFVELAEESGLICSGGSDFHGPDQGKNDLGLEKGDFRVPFSFYDDLRKAAGKWI
jgi:predicted metal-dependent phosphoesterase TrpH